MKYYIDKTYQKNTVGSIPHDAGTIGPIEAESPRAAVEAAIDELGEITWYADGSANVTVNKGRGGECDYFFTPVECEEQS